MYNGLPWPEEEFIKVKVPSIFHMVKIILNDIGHNRTRLVYKPPAFLPPYCLDTALLIGKVVFFGILLYHPLLILPSAELGLPSATALCW